MDSQKNTISSVIDQVRSPIKSSRNNALSQMPQILGSIGIFRFCQEFIPYCIDSCFNIADDWTFFIDCLAKIDFSPFTLADYSNFLQSTAILQEIDSVKTRSSYIALVSRISERMGPTITKRILLPFLSDSLPAKTWPPAQMSLILSIAGIASRLTQLEHAKIVKLFVALSEDGNFKVPLVRASLVEASTILVDSLDAELQNSLHLMISSFFSDESSVVLCALPKFLAAYSQKSGKVGAVYPLFMTLMKNDNWRIRYIALRNLPLALQNQDYDLGDVFDLVESASGDPDDSVREALPSCLPILAPSRDTKRLTSLVGSLLVDKQWRTREMTIRVIPFIQDVVDIGFIASKMATLLNDNHASVRSAAISILKNPTLSPSIRFNIANLIVKNGQWRERLELSKILPVLFGGTQMTPNIQKLIQGLLSDGAKAVRSSTIDVIPVLFQAFDPQVPLENLIQTAKAFSADEDYQIRQTAFFIALRVGPNCKEALSVVESLSHDPLSNVRYVIAKYLPRELLFNFQHLVHDADEDVREAASS